MTNPSLTIFCLLLFAIPSQLGRHYWPSFSIINGLRVDYLSPTLYFSDLVIGLFFIEMLPVIIKTASKLWLAAITLILVYLATIAWGSLSPTNSLLGLLRVIEMIFVVFACSRFLSNSKLRPLFQTIIALSMCLVSLLTLWQVSLQSSVGGLWYWLGERTFTSLTPGIANASLGGTLFLRPYATFPHPNVLAAFLVVMSCYLLFFEISAEITGFKKWLSPLSLFMGLVATFLSMSRTGIAVLLLVYGVWLIKRFIISQKIFAIMFMGVLLIGWLMVKTDVYLRFTTLSFSDEAVVIREFLLAKSWQMFQSHPLVGVGLQNFLPALARQLSPTTPLVYFQPVHSLYLLILSETGVVGGILAGVLLGYLVYQILRSTERLGKSMLLVALLLLGLTDHYFYTLHQGQLLLAFGVGLILSSHSLVFTRLEAKNLRKPVASHKPKQQPVKIPRTGR